jgi:heme-degrading monooxygenase HmoA
MHAMVSTVEIKAGRGDEAVATLKDQVVAKVKTMPGFVSGTWARSADGTKGHSVVIFENRGCSEGRGRTGKSEHSPGGAGEDPLFRDL